MNIETANEISTLQIMKYIMDGVFVYPSIRVVGLESWTWTRVGLESGFWRTWTWTWTQWLTTRTWTLRAFKQQLKHYLFTLK